MNVQLDQVYEFTLLNPKSIVDIFTRRHHNQPKKIHMPLPAWSGQCVHMYEEELSEGFEVVYCDQPADPHGLNGFLCSDHNELLNEVVRLRATAKPRSIDQEVIDHILTTDARAIAQGRRVEVRTTVKGESISFLED